VIDAWLLPAITAADTSSLVGLTAQSTSGAAIAR